MIVDIEDGRNIALAGVPNFRDYGGYACSDGRLKRRMLFRSAQHCDATNADLGRIARIGFADVIDLRGSDERFAAPCRRPEGFSARVHFVDDVTAGLAPPYGGCSSRSTACANWPRGSERHDPRIQGNAVSA
jgi:hypothetical protein